jgi:hypothetical protein
MHTTITAASGTRGGNSSAIDRGLQVELTSPGCLILAPLVPTNHPRSRVGTFDAHPSAAFASGTLAGATDLHSRQKCGLSAVSSVTLPYSICKSHRHIFRFSHRHLVPFCYVRKLGSEIAVMEIGSSGRGRKL